MSITAAQRAALLHASRPPGPPALWYAVGSVVKSVGAALDAFGVSLQGDSATVEKRALTPIPSRALAIPLLPNLPATHSCRCAMTPLAFIPSLGSSHANNSRQDWRQVTSR